MSYRDKFEQSDKKALNSLIATKILDLMDKLRLDANKNAQRRWIWELLQNAKDVSFDNQQVETEVFIQENGVQKSVSFSHNGKPFTVDNITFLIKQVSTKERNANPENEKPKTTGKFGTGFLTTHLLSEKVEVSGVVKEPDLDYRTFKLPLDRSGRTPEQIIESVNKSIIVRDTLDSQSPLSNYNPKAFNTSFCYNLEEEGYEVAKVGVEDLHISLPYTLAFLPSIKSVSIKHENTIYELAKIEQESADIQIVTIYKKVQSQTQEIKIVTLSKNNTTIAVEIEQSNGETFLKGFADELPKLFCDFPLIGTNDFNLPIVINSSSFNPNEPRDGIWLTEHNNEPKILENKQNIQDSVELYLILLRYASENSWQHLFHLAKTDTPKEKKWFSKSWFETNFQKPIRQNLLTTPIIDIVTAKRVSIEMEIGGTVDFPYHSKKEIREKIWEICNIENYFILPKKEEIHEWYEVIWDKKYYLTLETIANWISSQENLTNLSEKLGKDIENSMIWLNDFYSLIAEDEKCLVLISQSKLAIIPNQKGNFMQLKDLLIDSQIDDELKNVQEVLGIDLRSKLCHNSVRTWNKEKEKHYWSFPAKKTQENIIDELNKIIKEGKNENISKASDYLSSCFSDDSDFPSEQTKIYEFSQALWDMPEKRKIENWSESIWQEVNKLQIKRLIQTIAQGKNIEKLRESLKLDKTQSLTWLNLFIRFLVVNGYDSQLNQKTSPILPNQNGNFCIKDDLFLDNGEIDETLKDILESLRYEVREELLDLSIFLELPKSRERTEEFVADEISKLITPKFAEVPRTDETKQIFKSLYLWFNKHKSPAENLFSYLYANKHKLYDDDEIAFNMQKAEEFDSIMQEFGISDLDELRAIFKGGKGEIKQPKSEPIDPHDLIVCMGIASFEELELAKQEFAGTKIGEALQHLSRTTDFSYAHQIIERAKTNVKAYLGTQPNYNISNWNEESFTVIAGVLKNDREVKIVIRPADNGQIIIYYQNEFETLEKANTELWYDNGAEQGIYSFGRLLKRAKISRIPL